MGQIITPADIQRRASALRIPAKDLADETGLHENTVHDALKGKRRAFNATVVKIHEALVRMERQALFHLLRLHHAQPGIFSDLLVTREEPAPGALALKPTAGPAAPAKPAEEQEEGGRAS